MHLCFFFSVCLRFFFFFSLSAFGWFCYNDSVFSIWKNRCWGRNLPIGAGTRCDEANRSSVQEQEGWNMPLSFLLSFFLLSCFLHSFFLGNRSKSSAFTREQSGCNCVVEIGRLQRHESECGEESESDQYPVDCWSKGLQC